jgi:hypothetical protein
MTCLYFFGRGLYSSNLMQRTTLLTESLLEATCIRLDESTELERKAACSLLSSQQFFGYPISPTYVSDLPAQVLIHSVIFPVHSVEPFRSLFGGSLISLFVFSPLIFISMARNSLSMFAFICADPHSLIHFRLISYSVTSTFFIIHPGSIGMFCTRCSDLPN